MAAMIIFLFFFGKYVSTDTIFTLETENCEGVLSSLSLFSFT
jgi:hypothetical protein